MSVGSGARLTIDGFNEVIGATAGNAYVDIDQSGDVVTMTSGVLNAEANTQAIVNGSNDSSSIGANSTMTYSGAADGITAAHGGDSISVSGGAGDSVVVGGVGDTVTMGSGAVTAQAGATASLQGSNDTITTGGYDTLSIYGYNESIDATDGGDALTARLSGDSIDLFDGSLALGSNLNATISGANSSITTGNFDTLSIAAGGDTVTGGYGTDTVGDGSQVSFAGSNNSITAGNNDTVTLDGFDNTVSATGNGNVVRMDSGSGTFDFTSGNGDERVNVIGGSNYIQFGAGIADDQLWFEKVGNDLDVFQIGTTGEIDFTNWYSGAAEQITQFATQDGHTLANAQVQNLVTAMAGLTKPSSGETTLAAAGESSLEPTIAANWH